MLTQTINLSPRETIYSVTEVRKMNLFYILDKEVQVQFFFSKPVSTQVGSTLHQSNHETCRPYSSFPHQRCESPEHVSPEKSSQCHPPNSDPKPQTQTLHRIETNFQMIDFSKEIKNHSLSKWFCSGAKGTNLYQHQSPFLQTDSKQALKKTSTRI